MDKEIVKQIIIEELTKTEVNNMIRDRFSSEVNSRDFERKVREIIAKSLEDFYKTLWSKRNIWVGDIKK